MELTGYAEERDTTNRSKRAVVAVVALVGQGAAVVLGRCTRPWDAPWGAGGAWH